MADTNYEIVFRGDIAPGNNLLEVKERIRQLFKADDAQLEHLFSGRPVVVKRGLDKDTSERYRSAMASAGALVEVRPTRAEPDTADAPGAGQQAESGSTDRGSDDGGWGLAPLGADVLAAGERTEPPPKQIDTSHLSIAPHGADVLSASERSKLITKDIDTSHLSYKKNE